MDSTVPAEGVTSGVAPVKLENVNPPSMDSALWKEAGKVEQLFIYPVKSMRGISVTSATVSLWIPLDRDNPYWWNEIYFGPITQKILNIFSGW